MLFMHDGEPEGITLLRDSLSVSDIESSVVRIGTVLDSPGFRQAFNLPEFESLEEFRVHHRDHVIRSASDGEFAWFICDGCVSMHVMTIECEEAV